MTRLLHGAVSGQDAGLLQATLKALGFDPGQLDGVYGPDTAAAVRRYQAARGLAADGVVGQETWDRISAEDGAATEGRRLQATIVGATSGQDVLDAQTALQAAGFDPGDIDGIYGPDTAAAVLLFQRVHGLPADGIIGPHTQDALLVQRLRLSPTVAAVLGEVPSPTGPFELAVKVLARHGEYGNGLARSTLLPAEPGGIHLPSYRWLAEVRTLFEPERAPELHGRLLLIGLSLLDPDVAAGLASRSLVPGMAGELSEPLDTLLTERGRELSDRDPFAARSLARLSPSAASALSYADGLRAVTGSDEVHMEHLLGGLNLKDPGPTRRLLDASSAGQEGFASAVAEQTGSALPASALPRELAALPKLSRHATRAMANGFRLADAIDSPLVHSRHLLYGALSVDECGLVQALADRGVRAADVEDWDQPGTAAQTAAGPAVAARLLAGAAADTVPEPGDGRVRSADRLGIADEVEMLVSVLLARDTPLPLAVGLFGDWGSGKSFFMALMEERMAELARLSAQGRPEAAPFCREIRQVRFNAWHYVDTDLWSSLATTLFDKLAGTGAPDETQAKLSELDQARVLARTARTEREELERAASALEADVQRPARAARSAAAAAIRAVRHDRELRSALRRVAVAGAAPATPVVPGDQPAERLATELGEVQGTASKIGTTWRLVEEELLHRRRGPTLLTLVVLLGVAVGVSVLTHIPAGIKAVAFAGAVAATLGPALDGALRILYLARDAREARELPLMKKRDQLARARAAEDAAGREVARREEELARLRDKGLRLQDFVRERAASPDYRSRLGVISQVRGDFEQLVALVPGSAEPGLQQVTVAAAEVTRRIPQVERIVLFVDDLDRCPHSKVVEVLQAVHLLLAFKLFVVVVGVDSRWLEHSLRAHYRELLAQPDNYLEKIFQIPFTLRRMTAPRYRQLIDELMPRPPASAATLGGQGRTAGDTLAAADGAGAEGKQPPETPGAGRPLAAGDSASREDSPGGSSLGGPASDGESSGHRASRPASRHAPAEPPPLPRPEALVISEPERALLGQLGDIVSTPRAAKRLVNIYRMLRVSVPQDELEAFSPDGGNEYQAAVVLLAVLVGRPMLAEQILTAIVSSRDDDEVWPILTRFAEVGDALQRLRPHIALDRSAPYRRWAPRVSRFSFRFSAVLRADEPAAPEA